jgi:hypothetical protein
MRSHRSVLVNCRPPAYSLKSESSPPFPNDHLLDLNKRSGSGHQHPIWHQATGFAYRHQHVQLGGSTNAKKNSVGCIHTVGSCSWYADKNLSEKVCLKASSPDFAAYPIPEESPAPPDFLDNS